jgi:CO/xanthine dehydrogenase FAD-binding subunit
VEALASDPAAVPLAGGTDLMVAWEEGYAEVPAVVDLSGIPEMTRIRRVGDSVEIGAATTFTRIRHSRIVRRHFPCLAQAAGVIGSWQIQNRATLGGNMVNASPAGDALPALLALDAVVLVAGPSGRREIPYEAFHTGYRETALAPGEIVTAVHLPIPRAPSFQAFHKVGTRQAQAISKVVVALAARTEEGCMRHVRIAAGSVAPVPLLLRRAEAVCEGAIPALEVAERAGEAAAEEASPIDDIRSTAAYRRYVLGRIVRRMILQAAGSR